MHHREHILYYFCNKKKKIIIKKKQLELNIHTHIPQSVPQFKVLPLIQNSTLNAMVKGLNESVRLKV
jgi:hypothetical protein